MAQKAMEAWQGALAATKSKAAEQDLHPGSTGQSHGVCASSTSRSPGSPPRGQSIQAREWLDTPHSSTERSFRTPLPTEKEQRPEAPSSKRSNSPVRGNETVQATMQGLNSWSSPTQSKSLIPSTELSPAHGSEQRSFSRSEEYPAIVPNVRDTSGWHRDENRQLPPISSMSLQLAETGKNTLPQPVNGRRAHVPVHIAGGLEGGLNTFPSNFSVLTAEAIQRNQAAGNRIGKRRGKKSGSGTPNRVDDRLLSSNTLPNFGLDDQQSGNFLSRRESQAEDGPSRPPPQSRDQLPRTRSMEPKPAITNSGPRIHHIVQPQRSPPPRTIQPKFQPPPVIFTLDNRAESPLATSDVQPFIEGFTQNTSVLLPNPTSDKEASAHSVSVIMWQSLLDFYKWYAEISGVKEVGPLMFELLDVHWQEEKSFVVPEGNLNYFRTIKQYIWDLYWLAVDINKAPALFRVLVTPFQPRSAISPSRQESNWRPANTRLSDLPAIDHGSGHHSHMAAEPRPVSQSLQQPLTDRATELHL
ncbi:hypothetical protein BDZ45DRAFT_235740 [Acephala macrosclerotiorum]|nr:hypothetical protein BDZ45DRAFT_235740 [Acephala macrosclerotiorum]